jgi:hypothetical protein
VCQLPRPQAPRAIRRSLVAAAPRHRRRHGRPVAHGPHRLNLSSAIKGREPNDNSPFASSATKNRVLTSLLTRSAADRFYPAREPSRSHAAFALLFIAQDPLLRPQIRIMPPPPSLVGECPSPCASPLLVVSKVCLMSMTFSCSYKTRPMSSTLSSHRL